MSIPHVHVNDIGNVQIQNVTVPNYNVYEPTVNLNTTVVVEY